jgi:Domain of unknown function (DUF4287)/Domain of unknown function (DUF5655)
MTFQAYIDNIKAKTGKSPEDFHKLAVKNGLLKPGVKTGEIVQWLKSDFQLGHGHAMAIAAILMTSDGPKPTDKQKFDQLFVGKKSSWRTVCEDFIGQIRNFGPDVKAPANETYVNLLRGTRKFGILQPSAGDRLDVGIKFKGVPPQGRLEVAGSWNAMVTHRVKINKPSQLDSELLAWLREAYHASPNAKALSK